MTFHTDNRPASSGGQTAQLWLRPGVCGWQHPVGSIPSLVCSLLFESLEEGRQMDTYPPTLNMPTPDGTRPWAAHTYPRDGEWHVEVLAPLQTEAPGPWPSQGHAV